MWGGREYMGNLSIFHFILLKPKELLKHKVCFFKNVITEWHLSGSAS